MQEVKQWLRAVAPFIGWFLLVSHVALTLERWHPSSAVLWVIAETQETSWSSSKRDKLKESGFNDPNSSHRHSWNTLNHRDDDDDDSERWVSFQNRVVTLTSCVDHQNRKESCNTTFSSSRQCVFFSALLCSCTLMRLLLVSDCWMKCLLLCFLQVLLSLTCSFLVSLQYVKWLQTGNFIFQFDLWPLPR